MKTYMFLDLETTGLDPNADRIVEVGWMYADAKLRRLTTTSYVVVKPVGDALNRIYNTPVVLDMHTKTGLLSELHDPTLPLLQQVENSIIEEFDEIEASYQKFRASLSEEELLDPIMTAQMEFVLAGKNVYFDKGFVDRYMPRLAARLSHRTLDETSMKYMLEAIGVGVNIAPDKIANGLQQHRAGYDVELSYTTMSFILEQFREATQSERFKDSFAEAFVISSDTGDFRKINIHDELDDDLRNLRGDGQ